MADAYVIVGLHRERCRAKVPSKCRYHVGPDGKPLKHYRSAASADKELKRLLNESENEDETDDKDEQSPEPAEIDPDDGEIGVPSLILDIDDGNGADDDVTNGDRLFSFDWHEDTSIGDGGQDLTYTMNKLNAVRRDSSLDDVESRAAIASIMTIGASLRGSGRYDDVLCWTDGTSPVEWPEWASTRRDEKAALKAGATSVSNRTYHDAINASVAWSQDDYDDEKGFSTSLVGYTAGFYDAVDSGKLMWDDLKKLGAAYAWMESSMITDRSGKDDSGHHGDAVLRTVVTWIGRKPPESDGPDSDGYVVGDDHSSPKRACRSLKTMVDTLEEMSAGMGAAVVELHVRSDSTAKKPDHSD